MYIKEALKVRKILKEYKKDISNQIKRLEEIPMKQIYVFRDECIKAKDLLSGEYVEKQEEIPSNIPINKLWDVSEELFQMYVDAMVKIEDLSDYREEFILENKITGEKGIIIPFPRKKKEA